MSSGYVTTDDLLQMERRLSDRVGGVHKRIDGLLTGLKWGVSLTIILVPTIIGAGFWAAQTGRIIP